MATTRPDRDEWHLAGARWLAEMGDCTRRKVGALIVGPDKRFPGLGYNGARPGGKSCLKGDCPRGRHYEVTDCGYCHDDFCSGASSGCYLDTAYGEDGELHAHRCGCGGPWPCPDAVEPGSSYDTGPGACIATHAEANAVADAQQRGGGRLADCTMYVSCEPCEGCVRHVRNVTDIKAIIWPGGAVALP